MVVMAAAVSENDVPTRQAAANIVPQPTHCDFVMITPLQNDLIAVAPQPVGNDGHHIRHGLDVCEIAWL